MCVHVLIHVCTCICESACVAYVHACVFVN